MLCDSCQMTASLLPHIALFASFEQNRLMIHAILKCWRENES